MRGRPSPEHVSDPLFWPLLFLVLIVNLFVWRFVQVIRTMARREPGHHPQIAGPGGSNTYDASSHTTINVRDVNLGAVPKRPEDD